MYDDQVMRVVHGVLGVFISGFMKDVPSTCPH